jgi:phosphatidylserine/phosphatidylglycerophosphate/cardiolipin synthase-like enzyme
LDVRAPEDSPTRWVITAITDAARRGLDVQVLLGTPSDPRLDLLNRVAARYMTERGVAIRSRPDLNLHSKFVIVDDAFCTIGSHNITHKALSQNAELSAVVWDTATATALTKSFATMWGDGYMTAEVSQVFKWPLGSAQTWLQGCQKSLVATKALSVAFETIEVLENANYFTFCHAALGEAQRRIVVAMGLMTFSGLRSHPARQLIEQVIAAHHRGVSVDVFTGTTPERQARDRLTAASNLQAAGVSVHFIRNGRSFHHKALVIDEHLTIIGSHNWTLPALWKNRELSLAVRSTALAFQITQAIVAPFSAL